MGDSEFLVSTSFNNSCMWTIAWNGSSSDFKSLHGTGNHETFHSNSSSRLLWTTLEVNRNLTPCRVECVRAVVADNVEHIKHSSLNFQWTEPVANDVHQLAAGLQCIVRSLHSQSRWTCPLLPCRLAVYDDWIIAIMLVVLPSTLTTIWREHWHCTMWAEAA